MNFEEIEDLKLIQDFALRENFFRIKSGLSARELSLRLGKHPSYINALEAKGFAMPITIVYKMIRELGVTTEQFFADDYKNYNKNNEIYNLIKNMSEASKDSVLAIIKNMK